MNIVIMAGGTGGHIFPALAVADELSARGATIHWLGTKTGMEYAIVKEAGYRFYPLTVMGLRGRSWYRRMLSLFKVAVACVQALLVMRRLNPVVVLGMGGYVSGPGALAAYVCRIPLVVHEQNAVLGVTNRFLQPLATHLLSAFPNTFSSKRVTPKVTGNPVRRNLLGLSPISVKAGDRLRLLVLGGSQGARCFNQRLPNVIARLMQMEETVLIDVWHIAGDKAYESTKATYQSVLGNEVMSEGTVRVDAFCRTMDKAYEWATLVLCRSGAMTVSELSVVGRPSILVPYPYAVDDHQTANANYLVSVGAGVLIQEQALTENALINQLIDFYQNPSVLNTMAKAAREIGHHMATKAVSDSIMGLLHASAALPTQGDRESPEK